MQCCFLNFKIRTYNAWVDALEEIDYKILGINRKSSSSKRRRCCQQNAKDDSGLKEKQNLWLKSKQRITKVALAWPSTAWGAYGDLSSHSIYIWGLYISQFFVSWIFSCSVRIILTMTKSRSKLCKQKTLTLYTVFDIDSNFITAVSITTSF